MLSCGQRGGEVFLDGDYAFEGVVPGFVDDAEAALAYDSGDFEFGEAAAYGEEAGFVCACGWAGDRGA
ncbi:hypothetical protein VCH24_39450 [Variovorax boronicumulans]|nr:hypothetical protein VCH24_39450 [Variovorax boronicumulans]